MKSYCMVTAKSVLPKSESMKKMVAVRILCVLNLRILEPFHIAAGHRPALRHLGNTPLILQRIGTRLGGKTKGTESILAISGEPFTVHGNMPAAADDADADMFPALKGWTVIKAKRQQLNMRDAVKFADTRLAKNYKIGWPLLFNCAGWAAGPESCGWNLRGAA